MIVVVFSTLLDEVPVLIGVGREVAAALWEVDGLVDVRDGLGVEEVDSGVVGLDKMDSGVVDLDEEDAGVAGLDELGATGIEVGGGEESKVRDSFSKSVLKE